MPPSLIPPVLYNPGALHRRSNFERDGCQQAHGRQMPSRVASRLDEPYERGCQGKIFPPSSPRGDECGDWHPAQSEIWRGFVFATCFSQTKAIDGVCSTVS